MSRLPHLSPPVYGVVATACFVLAVLGWRLMRDTGVAVELEVDAAGDSRVTRRPPLIGLMRALESSLAAPVMRLLGPRRMAKVRRTLDAGGRPGGMTLEGYAGRKGALTVSFGSLGLVLALNLSWLLVIPVLLLGWILIDAVISGAARRRQATIERELPDFLDILAVCVGAGIAFRPALARVADARGGPLADEIRTTLHQLTLGASRRQAFEALRERNTSPFLGTFVSSLLQAEELGVPLTDAIVDQARDMRRASYQHARQRAQKAAPRIALVVVLFVMPGALILIVAALFFSASGGLTHFGRLLGG